MGFLCFGKKKQAQATAMTTRERRLSVTVEEDTILSDSAPGASAVLSEAGVEFSRIKVNQDAYLVSEDKMVFAVFDGHGRTGHHCSQYVREHLPKGIQAQSPTAEGLSEALVKIGDDMVKDPTIDSQFSGTTVLVVMVTHDTVTSAWLGDSRAIMGRWTDNKLKLVELSQDHKPEIPAEKKRITKLGGCVRQLKDENGQKCGPYRVFKPSSTVPGVNFSRSLGDQVIHKYGVTSQVQCIIEPRTRDDRFIVVASDGIFEFLSNLDVLDIVSSCATVEAAARQLSTKARDLWIKNEQGSSDDLTVIVVKLS